MSSAPSSTTEVEKELLLVEYGQLKAEQQARIQHRDGLVYTTLAAMAAVVAGTISQHATAVLLLLPPVALVLAWKYLAADEKIDGIARYIRDRLATRLATVTGLPAEQVFGWESAHHGGHFRRVRRYVQVAGDLLTFCVLPAAALVAFWTLGPTPVGLVGVSVVEAGLLAGLGWLVVIATFGTNR